MSDRIEIEHDTVDGQIRKRERRYPADVLARRVEPGEAGTLRVSKVIDDQLRYVANAAVTTDVVSRCADASRRSSRHFRVRVVVAGFVDGARRRSPRVRIMVVSSSSREICHAARRQNRRRRQRNDTAHVCMFLDGDNDSDNDFYHWVPMAFAPILPGKFATFWLGREKSQKVEEALFSDHRSVATRAVDIVCRDDAISAQPNSIHYL